MLNFGLLCDRSEIANPSVLLSVTRFVLAFAENAHPVEYLETFEDSDIIDAMTMWNVLSIARN